jgi:hypothetical protein
VLRYLIFTLTVTHIKVRTGANYLGLLQQLNFYFSLYFSHLERNFERRCICKKSKLAERAGFEPAVRFETYTRFPGVRFKPLIHLSGRADYT